jgi:glutamyl-tRNA reductase
MRHRFFVSSQMFLEENVTAKRAIIIGGSMAGLLAARVLSNHVEEVIILGRDPIHDYAESRKGQPRYFTSHRSFSSSCGRGRSYRF